MPNIQQEANINEQPIITKVKPRIIIPSQPYIIPERHRPKQIIRDSNPQLTLWQKIKLYSKIGYIGFRLLPHLITIRYGIMTNNVKTTISGIIKALFLTLSLLGVSTGHVSEAIVTTSAYAIVDLIQAFFTADAKKSNGE